MAYELIGKNFTPPDVRAKVTGSAKYSEDFRMDGMLFCKLLTSPMPHARVVSVDASEALAMPGVEGILRASEVPQQPAPSDPILTDEPHYVGEPILAVAAVDEATAAEIELGAQDILVGGATRAYGYRQDAALSRARASSIRTGAQLAAGSTLLTTVAGSDFNTVFLTEDEEP